MRLMISCGNLMFLIAVLILTHCSIISAGIRENEVAGALSDTADYGIDIVSDYYKQTTYDPAGKNEYLNKLMMIFCQVVADRIGTDGEVTVTLKDADLEKGMFTFALKETYTFPFGQRKGVCYLEKVYILT